MKFGNDFIFKKIVEMKRITIIYIFKHEDLPVQHIVIDVNVYLKNIQHTKLTSSNM